MMPSGTVPIEFMDMAIRGLVWESLIDDMLRALGVEYVGGRGENRDWSVRSDRLDSSPWSYSIH